MTVSVRPTILAGAVAGLCLLAAASLADTILADGRTWNDAKVQWVEDGRIRFTDRDGSQQAVPITSVTRLGIDLREALNRAEQLRLEGKPAEAIEVYQEALRTENRSYLAGYIRYRLLDLYGRTGELDRAVELFVQLVGQPDYLLAVREWRPAKIDPAAERARAAALARLDEALRQERAGLASDAIRQLRQAIAAGKVQAAGPSTPASSTPAEGEPTGSLVDRARVWFARGEPTRALQAADAVLGEKGVQRDMLEQALYVRGVALWHLAKDREQVLHSGWALARLLVEFPASLYIPEARYYLARVHERLGRPDQAMQMLQQVQNAPNAADELKERARRAYVELSTRR